MLPALCILTVALVIGTLLPLSRAKHWWVRSWDFPRTQLAALSGIVIVSIGLTGVEDAASAAILGVATLVGLYQMVWIWPFTPLHRPEVPHQPPDETAGQIIRIFTVNVLQSNRDAEQLRALIRSHRPDILLAVEADDWWQDQLKEFQTELPHSCACPLGNFYGMLLLSRWPLHDAKIQFLIEPDTPSMHTAIILPDGTCLRLVCLHPAPPSPTENEKSTERDAELILVARTLEHERRPVIVMGDLNDVAWSRTTRLFRKISGLLDPRVGRGLFNTFHAKLPLLRWPVDHLFHSSHFNLVELRRLPAFGSDHFPMFATLALSALPPPETGAPPDRAERDTAARESTPSRRAVHVPSSPIF